MVQAWWLTQAANQQGKILEFSQNKRSRKLKKVLFIPILSALLLFSSCAQPAETPPPQEQEGIRVEVSRNGFNGTGGEFRIEVEEGEEIEITFVYGDKDFSQNNPHIIAFPTLGITTNALDENNPEETVRFTATETGEIVFMCTKVDCVGHPNLIQGRIVIK